MKQGHDGMCKEHDFSVPMTYDDPPDIFIPIKTIATMTAITPAMITGFLGILEESGINPLRQLYSAS